MRIRHREGVPKVIQRDVAVGWQDEETMWRVRVVVCLVADLGCAGCWLWEVEVCLCDSAAHRQPFEVLGICAGSQRERRALGFLAGNRISQAAAVLSRILLLLLAFGLWRLALCIGFRGKVEY